MTTDQKPWRAEMPKTYDVPPPWTEGVCDSESVWCLVVDANANADRLLAELDAARAELASTVAQLRAVDRDYHREHLMRVNSQEALDSVQDELDAARARIAELEARIAARDDFEDYGASL